MTWNYRIIAHADHIALHEVHYDDDARPASYTDGPVTFVADPGEKDDIVGGLERALVDASRFPVLDVSVFELPVDQRPVCPRSLPTLHVVKE